MHLITMKRRAIVAATLTFALAACGTAGPSAGNAASVETYRGNPSRTGEMAGPGPSGQPAIAWQFDAGAGQVVPLDVAGVECQVEGLTE